jgi:hypothetical protein
MTHSRKRSLGLSAAALLAGSLLVLSGCSGGGKGTTASGKVTKGGQAVPGGTITFVSARDKHSAALRPDGTYEVTNLGAGVYKVTIDNLALRNAPGTTRNSPKPPKGVMLAGGDPGNQPRYVPIHNKYRSEQTTDLKVTLESGKNANKDFEVN